MVHVVIVDGKEVLRTDDTNHAAEAFGVESKADFTDRVELLRVLAVATRGVQITRSYRERSAKATAKRGPRKVKAEAAS